jgi:hypothetical protein
MKGRKAAGSDNTSAKILKLGSSKAADMLLPRSKKFGRGKYPLRSGKKDLSLSSKVTLQ